jgi:4-hydroxy-tetrahydrodipicolinate synthase
VALHNAGLASDLRLVAELHALAMYLDVFIYWTGGGPSSVFKAVKYALSLVDICQDTMAAPLQRFPIGECETLRERIKKLVSHPCRWITA